jgi:hypothetical protein
MTSASKNGLTLDEAAEADAILGLNSTTNASSGANVTQTENAGIVKKLADEERLELIKAVQEKLSITEATATIIVDQKEKVATDLMEQMKEKKAASAE